MRLLGGRPAGRRRTPAPASSLCGHGRFFSFSQGGETCLFQVVAVEKVVGVEGDEAAIGVNDVDAGFLDAADVEGVGVNELHDDDAEDVVVGERGNGGRDSRFLVASRLGMTRRFIWVVWRPDFGEA